MLFCYKNRARIYLCLSSYLYLFHSLQVGTILDISLHGQHHSLECLAHKGWKQTTSPGSGQHWAKSMKVIKIPKRASQCKIMLTDTNCSTCSQSSFMAHSVSSKYPQSSRPLGPTCKEENLWTMCVYLGQREVERTKPCSTRQLSNAYKFFKCGFYKKKSPKLPCQENKSFIFSSIDSHSKFT